MKHVFKSIRGKDDKHLTGMVKKVTEGKWINHRRNLVVRKSENSK
jgi:hypothetical protein